MIRKVNQPTSQAYNPTDQSKLPRSLNTLVKRIFEMTKTRGLPNVGQPTHRPPFRYGIDPTGREITKTKNLFQRTVNRKK